MITVAALRRWLADALGAACGIDPSEVDLDRPVREYGLTSREAIRLVGDLEDLLDRDLPATLVWQHSTIAALADALAGEEPDVAAPVNAPVSAAEPVAVIGIGCRLPGGIHGPDQFWQLLADGRSAVTQLPADRWAQFGQDSPEQADRLARTTRWGGFLDDVAAFDADFFGITPREAVTMDPQQRMLLEVAWEALEHAGVAADRLRGSATGVFVGISGTEYAQLTFGDLSRVDAWSATGAALSIAANRLSYALDLRGPSVALDTACSSSLVAVHMAAASLRAGECELALAAGANLLLGPGITASMDTMGVTSPDGRCKTFDASADGIVRAEGVGVVVLKPLSAAQRDGDRVLAVLRGSAVNSDGRSNGLAAPNPDAQTALLRSAYAAAGVDPAGVDYVEAHGTGTLVGDPIEANALGAVLGRSRPADHPLLIGSVKTNLGHLEAAAGVAGLIKVVLALVHRRIPASLHFTAPNPHIAFDELGLAVAAEPAAWPERGRPNLAGVSGFGFGGTNAHVVLEQAPEPAAASQVQRPMQFLLAAGSRDRLRRSADQLADWLADRPVSLPDVEHTLARRASGRVRAVVTARTTDELVTGLRSVDGVTADRQGPVWVFSGHGAQWAGMGQRLLATEPAFAAAVDEVDAALTPELGLSFRDVLASGVEPDRFEDLQPVIFGLQVALARLWQHYGVQPAAVIGHSLGELAAAVVSGALSLADGARLVTCRARLLAATAGIGVMAVLELPSDEVSALLSAYPDVTIALYNSPRHTAVAGVVDQVHALVADVEQRGVAARLINSTVAGHCSLVADAAAELGRLCADVDAKPPSVTVYPTAVADPPVVFDTDYWVANVRQPVRFTQAVRAALDDGYRTFVEISTHPVLRLALTETAADATVLGTLRRSDDETWEFHGNLGRLLAAGHVHTRTTGRLIDLPTTPWQHARHWLPPAPRPVPAGSHPLLGVHLEVPERRTHVWEADLGTHSQPWLSEHRIGGRPVLPAACYVDMALVAASVALDRPVEHLALTDLSLHQPLPLAGHTPVTTTFADGCVQVHSRASDGQWTLHCAVQVADAGVADQPEPPADDGGTPVSADELHRRLRSLGVDYGPAFAGVTGLRATAGTATATVAVPEGTPRAGYVAHPAVLDSCFQCLAALVPDEDAVYLPVEFASVRLFGDPALGVRAHVRKIAAEIGEVRLLAEDGRVLLEITGVYMRRMRAAELAPPLRDGLLGHVWQQENPPAGHGTGPVLLVAPDGHPMLATVRTALCDKGIPIADDLSAQPSSVVLLVADGTEDGLAAGRQAVLDGVAWARRLAELPRPPRLWLVTSSAAAVLPGEPGRPGPAAVRGLVRVLGYEHPALRTTWLDVADARDVVTELACGASDDEVAWRAGTRHVGRLVRRPLPEPDRAIPVIRKGGGYVITGGLGGLGLLLAGWLADGGAGTVVLNGRSAPGPAATAVIDELRAAGCDIQVVLGDVAAPGVAEQLVANRPVGIVHAAAVFDDAPVSTLDEQTLDKTWLPKASGAWRLHEASAGLDLDWWLGFSSTTALHGMPGQPAYASANAYLDALAALRRARGLPATTINWGKWADVGAAANLDVPWLDPIGPREGLEVLADILGAGPAGVGAAGVGAAGVGMAGDSAAAGVGAAGVGACRLNVDRLVGDFPGLRQMPFFTALAGTVAVETESTGWPGVAAVRELPAAEARRLVTEQVRYRIASVTGLRVEDLPDDRPLIGLGIDSLLAVRIRNAVRHDFELNLPMSVLLRGGSLADLCDRMCTDLGIQGQAPAPVANVLVPPRDAAERLVAAAWREVLGVPVGITHDFAALGGDAAAAERITALLSARTGSDLTVSALFERPTIELMADVVRAADQAAGPVRVLRATGPRPPLFFFHPGGGDTAVFRQLVELLDPPVAAYGFDRIDETVTVEERVTRSLPHLRELQPTRPYRLAGWSFGGFLAFEMAQQLTAAGEHVELLALIDPILPLPQRTDLSEVDLMALRFRRFGEFLETSYGKRVELPLTDMAGLDDEAQADLLIATILAADLVDRRVSEAILTHQRRSFLDARMLERYEPAPYPGRTVFYSAASQVPGGLRDPRFDRTDPARGWDAVCSNIDVVTVPGHHLSLLDPPNVEVMARHLSDLLR